MISSVVAGVLIAYLMVKHGSTGLIVLTIGAIVFFAIV